MTKKLMLFFALITFLSCSKIEKKDISLEYKKLIKGCDSLLVKNIQIPELSLQEGMEADYIRDSDFFRCSYTRDSSLITIDFGRSSYYGSRFMLTIQKDSVDFTFEVPQQKIEDLGVFDKNESLYQNMDTLYVALDTSLIDDGVINAKVYLKFYLTMQLAYSKAKNYTVIDDCAICTQTGLNLPHSSED